MTSKSPSETELVNIMALSVSAKELVAKARRLVDLCNQYETICDKHDTLADYLRGTVTSMGVSITGKKASTGRASAQEFNIPQAKKEDALRELIENYRMVAFGLYEKILAVRDDI